MTSFVYRVIDGRLQRVPGEKAELSPQLKAAVESAAKSNSERIIVGVELNDEIKHAGPVEHLE